MNRFIKNACTYTHISACTHQVELPNKAALGRNGFGSQLAHESRAFFPKTPIWVRQISPLNGDQYPAWSFAGANQSLSRLSSRSFLSTTMSERSMSVTSSSFCIGSVSRNMPTNSRGHGTIQCSNTWFPILSKVSNFSLF